MTAFTASTDLPASVNTLEKLVAWSTAAFYALHANTEYQESQGSALVPIATFQDGKAADKTERAIPRISLELEDNWRVDPQPFWVNVKSVSSAAIPSDFLP